MLRVFVITSDTYLWCLSPFSYLFNKYWSPEQEVVICGFHPPSFELPRNFKFYSMAPSNAPQSKWSNTLIKFLKEVQDEYSVLMLEDYWITRPVDIEAINVIHSYMQSNNRVLRFDLTGDTAYCNGDPRYAPPFGFINHYDIVEKPPGMSYRMSLQAGLWNNKLLSSLLVSDKSPWEVEIQTSVPNDILVLGTKQWPLLYANAVYKGELDMDELNKLHPIDFSIIEKVLPKDMNRRKKTE